MKIDALVILTVHFLPVMPAKAGIQGQASKWWPLDSGSPLRSGRNDECWE
jgi:hypothetical protein